jgi:hypothetical protein
MIVRLRVPLHQAKRKSLQYHCGDLQLCTTPLKVVKDFVPRRAMTI